MDLSQNCLSSSVRDKKKRKNTLFYCFKKVLKWLCLQLGNETSSHLEPNCQKGKCMKAVFMYNKAVSGWFHPRPMFPVRTRGLLRCRMFLFSFWLSRRSYRLGIYISRQIRAAGSFICHSHGHFNKAYNTRCPWTCTFPVNNVNWCFSSNWFTQSTSHEETEETTIGKSSQWKSGTFGEKNFDG